MHYLTDGSTAVTGGYDGRGTTRLFMMHPEKAPVPDGMTTLFFQHSWHLIRHDLVEMVYSF